MTYEDNAKFNRLLDLGMNRDTALLVISRCQELRRKREAVGDVAAKAGIGRWEMISSVFRGEDYTLNKN